MKINIPLYLMIFLCLSLLVVGCSKSNKDSDKDSDVTMIEAKDVDKYNEEYVVRNGVKIISLSQLYSHNEISDCWIGLGIEVYDISNFLNSNPDLGLAQYCGTSSFEVVLDSYNIDLIEVQKKSVYIGDLN